MEHKKSKRKYSHTTFDPNKKANNRNLLITIICLCVVAVMLVSAFKTFFDLSIVYVSNSTGECVEVRHGNKTLSCGNLPEKYHTILVE